jgi:HPt (histidine-containing phosphotransfer) domain-containing protein
MTEQNVIDGATFQNLFDSIGGDREFMAELLQTYFADSPELLATMESTLAAGDAEGLRRAAHSLKSSSANFGALTLSRLCKTVEDMAKTGTLDGAGAHIAAARAEYNRVAAHLQTL